MAPARPYWKGYLKLSLVSCPIALYTGTSSAERVSFRQINKKTGNRLRQQLVDEVTREPVEGEDKGRGYEYAKNAYVPADDDELDAITIDSNHTIEIDSFVPRQQIDQRYLDSPYHITPNDQVGQEAFAVIREAMRDKGMAAFGRVVLAKRERVIMLQPWDKGLMGRHCAIHTRLGMGKNLDALRRSIAQEQAASAPHKKRPKHLAGQGEMLLPVSGRKAKEAVAKPAERASAGRKKAG